MRPFVKILFLFFLFVLLSNTADAQNNTPSAAEITAKILLELPKYIQFPDMKQGVEVCIFGDTETYELVSSQNRKKLNPYDIRLVMKIANIDECNFVFTGNQTDTRKLIPASENTGVVLVSNYSSFIEEGGAVAVVDLNGNIEIELNLGVIAEKDIVLNPDLIDLSARVIQ